MFPCDSKCPPNVSYYAIQIVSTWFYIYPLNSLFLIMQCTFFPRGSKYPPDVIFLIMQYKLFPRDSKYPPDVIFQYYKHLYNRCLLTSLPPPNACIF